MSQHDMDIANQGAASFRADLNLALAALVSNNAGASEPSTIFAYQWWYDSTLNILKQRNAANDAWINVLKFDQTNDQVDTLYVRTLIDALVDNTADIGNSSRAFRDIYMQRDLYFDNDNSRTQDHYTWVPIASATASGSATLEFTLSTDFDYFLFVFESILPADDDKTLKANFSPDGGSGYHTNYGRSGYIASNSLGTIVSFHSTTQTGMSMGEDQGNNDVQHGLDGLFYVYNAASATIGTRANTKSLCIEQASTTNFIDLSASHWDKTIAAVNYIKFAYNAGNIASGSIHQYGKKFI